MAVDEHLMQSPLENGCLRFYRWDQPTLSLGYFQDYDDRHLHPASEHCPVVRRTSGGGAIVHDKELTYSLTLPAENRLAKRRLDLYRVVHAALVAVLADLGIRASIISQDQPLPGKRQPFLCFERRSRGDVVVGNVKVAGSAQRRSASAVMQHGSVLLGRSEAAPELTGLEQVGGTILDSAVLMRSWLEQLARRLHLEYDEQPLSTTEHRLVEAIAKNKFESEAWIKHRGRNPQTASRIGDEARGR
jgi:lipoate-protein ligase A